MPLDIPSQRPVAPPPRRPHVVRRYAAYAFDWTLVSLVVALVPGLGLATGFLVFVLLGAAYFICMEASSFQGTLGKYWTGLRVETISGQRLDHAQAATRFFAGTLSWASLNIGHMMAMWRPDGRALHDLLANTRVCQSHVNDRKHDIAMCALLAIHAAVVIWSVVEAANRAVKMAMEMQQGYGIY